MGSKKNKYADVDRRVNYILNDSEISELIQTVNKIHQHKFQWWVLCIYAVVVLCVSLGTSDHTYPDISRIDWFAKVILSGLIIFAVLSAVKSSNKRKLIDSNSKIRRYFEVSAGCRYISYVLEQRVKAKSRLDTEWWEMFKTFLTTCGLVGLISSSVIPKSSFVCLAELTLFLFISAYLMHSSPFGEDLNQATWELLSEDAHLALIENDSKKDCPCR